MKPAKNITRYAKTLVGIVGLDETPKALDELSRVEALMAQSRQFSSFLISPAFSKRERNGVLKEVGDKLGLSETVSKFVVHLSDRKVLAALPQIVKSANALYLEKKKRAKAVVMTPVQVGREYDERLKASLKKIVDRDVDLEYVIDPSLLGGVLVKVGSTMYDSSIRGQLRLLKDELIKG